MSQFKQLTKNVFVTTQLDTAGVAQAAGAGFTLIINNRPDGEEAGQPAGDALAQCAAAQGLQWASIPVAGGFPYDAIAAMAGALRDNTGKTLAFCRTGTRSTHLWALAEAFNKGMDSTEMLDRAAKAGYDISALAETLDQIRQMDFT